MKKNVLTTQDTQKIAKLANLQLKPEEIEKITKELSETITTVKVLSELSTDNTKGTFQVTGLSNVFRSDDVSSSLTQEEALSNGRETHNGYFVVPYVFDNEKTS